jgi:hypothetical protein
MPMAFTEQGVAMLSSVLNSPTAIDVNIQIIRVFSKMRELLLTNKDILLKLEQVEKKMMQQDGKMNQHDAEIRLMLAFASAPVRGNTTTVRKILS